jgi:hypothetical protein
MNFGGPEGGEMTRLPCIDLHRHDSGMGGGDKLGVKMAQRSQRIFGAKIFGPWRAIPEPCAGVCVGGGGVKTAGPHI